MPSRHRRARLFKATTGSRRQEFVGILWFQGKGGGSAKE